MLTIVSARKLLACNTACDKLTLAFNDLSGC